MGNNNYSLKERMIAKMLSSFPGIKKIVKRFYIRLNASLYKKSYKIKIGEEGISKPISTISLQKGKESFFGYYDKTPVNSDGWVINNISLNDTAKRIKENSFLEIVLSNIYSGEIISIGKSISYTWQQGARAQWIDNDRIIYNNYDTGKKSWEACVFSLSTRTIDKKFDFPIQDTFHDKYILALNYRRLYSVTDDYGYGNLGVLEEKELLDTETDGITIGDFNTGEHKLLFSLKDIIKVRFREDFLNAIHTVNHIMINKSGTHFIFIHRYYKNGVRRDRLLISDFEVLKVLSDNEMISHCCWFDDKTIYGYLRYKDKDGYYFINIDTELFVSNEVVNSLGLGDGHPSVYGESIVFDTYPNKSRMQELFIYNREQNSVKKILEVYQPMRFKESSRCDLHPRFSDDGNFIFFDSTFENKRLQYYIKIIN